jgi:predicted Zn finger-like uncharacterized protein
MFITCEKCKSVYCIADNVLNKEEQKVKCTKCSHIWVLNFNKRNRPNKLAQRNIILPNVESKKLSNKSDILITILLLITIIFTSFAFFPEVAIRFKIFSNIYKKCGIYDSQGLLLDEFIFEQGDKEVFIEGKIYNDTLEDKLVPDTRYTLLNSDKEKIFSFTHKATGKFIKAGEYYNIKTKIVNVNKDAAYVQIDIGNKLELFLRK